LPEHHPGAVLLRHARSQRQSASDCHDAAGGVPVEKRSTFLERATALQLRGSRFTDADLGAAIQAALTGLIQSAAYAMC